jgi:hypothetical protein
MGCGRDTSETSQMIGLDSEFAALVFTAGDCSKGLLPNIYQFSRPSDCVDSADEVRLVVSYVLIELAFAFAARQSPPIQTPLAGWQEERRIKQRRRGDAPAC